MGSLLISPSTVKFVLALSIGFRGVLRNEVNFGVPARITYVEDATVLRDTMRAVIRATRSESTTRT